MMGATSTPTGTPASASTRIAFNFAPAEAARGSSTRFMSLSSVGMLNITRVRPSRRELRQQIDVAHDQRALGGDAHRVLVLCSSTSSDRTCDFVVSFSSGWYGSVLAPSMMGAHL